MPSLVDMERSSEVENSPLMPMESKYPYGLRITLDAPDLEKLNVDHSNWEIGDVFPLDVFAKVVGKNSNETEGGQANCSISLQITHIGAEEESSEEANPASEKHGYLRYEA